MKLIFGLGQDIFEQFCSAIKSPIVVSDKKSETEFVELLSAALREDNVSSTLLHVLHVTLIGKNNFYSRQLTAKPSCLAFRVTRLGDFFANLATFRCALLYF